MACCHISANARDPTHTQGLRRDFLKDVRERFKTLRTRIRKKIGYQNDALHLMENAPGSILTPNAEKDRFEYTTEPTLIQAFTRWLKTAINEELLEPVQTPEDGGHWLAPYIRAAYGRGWKNSTGRLMQAGVGVENRDLSVVFNLPVPRSQLRDLYTRTYGNLTDITDEMADVIREEVTQGLAEGVNPQEMARRITGQTRAIQRTRAETLARTETINSYSEATLSRFEQAGVDTVRHGEWSAANDDRTCPICEYLDGDEYTIEAFRTETFEFPADDEDVPDYLAGTYNLRPPAHPNCRCSIKPVIT